MTRYRVEFTGAASRELRKLDPQIRRRLFVAVAELENDPRLPGVRKLAGLDNVWRIRVGDYRILYEVNDAVVLITIVRVGHRRDVYEGL